MTDHQLAIDAANARIKELEQQLSEIRALVCPNREVSHEELMEELKRWAKRCTVKG